MAILPLKLLPERCLREKAQPVEKVDDRIRKLLDDMLETMYSFDGVGLAANQVGILERLAVMDMRDKDGSPRPLKMVNPEIIWFSEEKQTVIHGCLSIPKQYGTRQCARALKFRYLDEQGKPQEREVKEGEAECIQHEIDHLNGILFIDYLSPLKRSMIIQRLNKFKRRKD
jgi:peptide deformylase